jgi:hypothetical protein
LSSWNVELSVDQFGLEKRSRSSLRADVAAIAGHRAGAFPPLALNGVALQSPVQRLSMFLIDKSNWTTPAGESRVILTPPTGMRPLDRMQALQFIALSTAA